MIIFMCKRRNQNSTKDLKQQLIKNRTCQNRDYQGKTFEKKNTTGGEFNSILKNSVLEKSDILCITNRKLCKDDFLKRIQIIAAAQPKAIVLREKDLSEEAYTILAEKVMHICEKYSVPCVLHSFAKAAMALNVKAIHMPLPLLRKMTPQEKNHFEIIGASCHSLEEALLLGISFLQIVKGDYREEVLHFYKIFVKMYLFRCMLLAEFPMKT